MFEWVNPGSAHGSLLLLISPNWNLSFWDLVSVIAVLYKALVRTEFFLRQCRIAVENVDSVAIIFTLLISQYFYSSTYLFSIHLHKLRMN